MPNNETLSWLIPAVFTFVLALLKLWSDYKDKTDVRLDKRESRAEIESDEELIQNTVYIWYDYLHEKCEQMRGACGDLPLPCGAIIGATSAAPSREEIETKVKGRVK